jgi:hypothetical protein
MKMRSKNRCIVAITLASLMMLPSFQQVYLGNKFESNRPVIYIENKNMPIKILNQTIDANILNTTVLYPDGTKKTTLSISAGQVVDGHPMVRVNFTYYTHPESQQANVPSQSQSRIAMNSTSMFSQTHQEEPQTILTPVPPPPVGDIPVPFYSWHDVAFLKAGLNIPSNGDPPFNVKYTQPDNYYTYYPRDWWTPWAFMTSLITQHLNKTVLEDVVAGHEDLGQLITTQFTYAGVALSLGGAGLSAVALFLSVKMGITSVLVTGFIPAIGIVIVIIGCIVIAVSAYLAQQQYDQKRWVQNVVETDQKDGFSYINISRGSDEVWWWDPYFSRPYTQVFHYCARNYYVSWGKDRDNFQYLSTEWWAYVDEFPKGRWPHATLRPEDYDFLYGETG